MSIRIIHRVDGIPIYWDGTYITFYAGMTIDADGAPNCYHPDGSPPGLDYTANAGRPGNWWALATDNQQSNGTPLIQKPGDPFPGFYISMTAYLNAGFHYSDPRRYLDSNVVPFVVIPQSLLNKVGPIFKGCECVAINSSNMRSSDAVLGDIGPNDHLGEGSMALAERLGISSDPKAGGVAAGILYRIQPGRPAVVDGILYELQSA